MAKKLPVTQEDMAHALSKDKPYLVVARRMRDPGDSDYNPWYDYKAVRASAEDLTGVIGRLDRENDGGHVRVGLELRLLPGGN